MGFETVVFVVAAVLALAGALGVVLLDNPFYSVLSLVGHLIALAVLFLLLQAAFVAAAQVVVYAGAVMVLYVFVVAYVGGGERTLVSESDTIGRLGPLFAGVLLVELTLAVAGSGLAASAGDGAPVARGFGSPAAIGELLLGQFLIVFETASFLLLVAAVGAVVLARRRRGLEEDDLDGDRAGPELAPASPQERAPRPGSAAPEPERSTRTGGERAGQASEAGARTAEARTGGAGPASARVGGESPATGSA